MHDPLPIITAGVYVNVAGCFPFQVGLDKSGGRLGVVRLGGHRQAHETAWECAEREALEEASLRVTSVRPPATYWADADGGLALQVGDWPLSTPAEVPPLLVTTRAGRFMTPVYMGSSTDDPIPAMEAQGLLLLTPATISQIVTQTITLGDYLEAGGKAVFREPLPLHLVLDPHLQLRLLHRLLELHPTLTEIGG